MNPNRVVHSFYFANEDDLKTFLGDGGKDPYQGQRRALVDLIRGGDAAVALVHEAHPRALILRSAVESLLGQALEGGDLFALPFK